jgi:hypothetical protein
VDASDFNWDESFVGGYDNPVGTTSVEGDATSSGSGPIGSVAANLVGKQVWTSQNGAPMLSTPNCEFLSTAHIHVSNYGPDAG